MIRTNLRTSLVSKFSTISQRVIFFHGCPFLHYFHEKTRSDISERVDLQRMTYIRPLRCKARKMARESSLTHILNVPENSS